MRTRRVLILVTTTSYRAGAFLEAARRLDVGTVVGTDRTQALAALNPEGHLTLDFLDPERAVAAIVEHAAHDPIDAVIAADDDGAVLGAKAAEALGLRHHPERAVAIARDKLRTRVTLLGAGVSSPRFTSVLVNANPDDAARSARFPCVLKPLFLAGSRGVCRANDPAEFVAAFRRITELLAHSEIAVAGGEAAKRILIEDYLPGREVAVEGLVTDGSLRVLAIFDKPDPLTGPWFEETLYVTPSVLEPIAKHTIVAEVERVVKTLGLSFGPVHAELRLHEGVARLIEIAPRSIGGLCSRALRFEGGISLEELILRHALGESIDAIAREPGASGVMMIPIPAHGRLARVSGRDEALAVPAIDDVRITIPLGQEVVPLPEGSRYLGFIFARAACAETVESALREAHSRLGIEIVPEPGSSASMV